MKVNFEDTLYDVRFHKSHRGTRRKRVVDTACVLSIVDPTKKGSDKYELFTKTISKHNHMDKYSKVTGKRLALAKAIMPLKRDARVAFFKAFDAEFANCK